MDFLSNVTSATTSTPRVIGQAANTAAEKTKEATNAAADTVSSGADYVVEISRDGLNAATDAGRQNAEKGAQTTQGMANKASDAAQAATKANALTNTVQEPARAGDNTSKTIVDSTASAATAAAGAATGTATSVLDTAKDAIGTAATAASNGAATASRVLRTPAATGQSVLGGTTARMQAAANRATERGASGLMTGIRVAQANSNEAKSRFTVNVPSAADAASGLASRVRDGADDGAQGGAKVIGQTEETTQAGRTAAPGGVNTEQEGVAKAGDERAKESEDTVADERRTALNQLAQAPRQPGEILSLLA